MTQYSIETNDYLKTNKSIYEVMYLANNANGEIVTTENRLPVDTHLSWDLKVSLGKVPGWTAFRLIGFNDTYGNTNPDTIWPKDGGYVFPPSATTMDVYSTNVSDTTQVLRINGLDSNYDLQTEDIVLNGQTGRTTTKSYLRINNCLFISGNPAGDVSIGTGVASAGIPTNTYEFIPHGYANSIKGVFTVPNGYRLASTNVVMSTGGLSSTQFATTALVVIGPNGVRYTRNKITVPNGNINFPLDPPVTFPGKTDFLFEGLTSGGGTASVNVSVGGYLIRDGF